MAAIARKKRYSSSSLLLTKKATVENVKAGILAAAKGLKAGDIFFLTYSGHGGQVPDSTGEEDEKDGKDETWVLYDRMLIDDELHGLWTRFAKGVRILVLSDSCHSGSVVKSMPWFLGMTTRAAKENRGRPKFIPPDVARRNYARSRKTYDDIQKRLRSGEKARVKASVLLLSGCQDNQVSYDGPRNGKFTAALRKAWKCRSRSGMVFGNLLTSRSGDEVACRPPPGAGIPVRGQNSALSPGERATREADHVH